jgi:hypothetical protein
LHHDEGIAWNGGTLVSSAIAIASCQISIAALQCSTDCTDPLSQLILPRDFPRIGDSA